jgi:hypothetical protein
LAAITIALTDAGKAPGPLPVPRPIAPKFEIIKKHRLMGDREFALRKYLRFVTFQTGVPSAARVRECLGRTRYNDLADRAVTEPKRRHDQYSHLASCCEYYAIYYQYRFVDPLDSKQMRTLQKQLMIDTEWCVARMADIQAIRDGTVRQLPRNAVGWNRFSGNLHSAVPVPGTSAGPQPTPTSSGWDENLIPKSCGNGGMLFGHQDLPPGVMPGGVSAPPRLLCASPQYSREAR